MACSERMRKMIGSDLRRFIGIVIAVALASLDLGAGLLCLKEGLCYIAGMDIVLTVVLLYLAKTKYEDVTFEVRFIEDKEENEDE